MLKLLREQEAGVDHGGVGGGGGRRTYSEQSTIDSITGGITEHALLVTQSHCILPVCLFKKHQEDESSTL